MLQFDAHNRARDRGIARLLERVEEWLERHTIGVVSGHVKRKVPVKHLQGRRKPFSQAPAGQPPATLISRQLVSALIEHRT